MQSKEKYIGVRSNLAMITKEYTRNTHIKELFFNVGTLRLKLVPKHFF